ncbi:hypothetical protein KJ819_02830 [Patescibacteria group bacterium]|nr:hypothetical protein [Patescibacteria group bacterium]MBU1500789.1 hypothetical protein [Patescibacteria group bacterium]MBU2080844.1 hypothetical protein [Patescibacteria group bacterium]MBU2123949.1 hypothetical protein [Patescibacteria group bacterium]MBU2194760.1 hypothetical protein [Patescibacteria group bacterium]
MASFEKHLETLRAQPNHVRHQVALFSSVGVTALVAFAWIATLATSGTLALSDTPGKEETLQVKETFAQSKSAFSELMGAVGAVTNGTGEPAITVVDTRTTTSFETKIENNTSKTVIPF